LAKSPGLGALVVGSCCEVSSFWKNWSGVRSMPSRKVSLPNRTLRGTTSIPYFSRQAGGRSAVESVTTRNFAVGGYSTLRMKG
jgi:hypothetical protein